MRLSIVSLIFPNGGRLRWLRRNVAFTVVPRPNCESICRPPPHPSAICRQRASPIPTGLVDRLVVKGSVTLANISSAIPFPLSRMVIVKRSFCHSSSIQVITRVALASKELVIISKICNDNSRIDHQGTPASGVRRPSSHNFPATSKALLSVVKRLIFFCFAFSITSGCG